MRGVGHEVVCPYRRFARVELSGGLTNPGSVRGGGAPRNPGGSGVTHKTRPPSRTANDPAYFSCRVAQPALSRLGPKWAARPGGAAPDRFFPDCSGGQGKRREVAHRLLRKRRLRRVPGDTEGDRHRTGRAGLDQHAGDSAEPGRPRALAVLVAQCAQPDHRVRRRCLLEAGQFRRGLASGRQATGGRAPGPEPGHRSGHRHGHMGRAGHDRAGRAGAHHRRVHQRRGRRAHRRQRAGQRAGEHARARPAGALPAAAAAVPRDRRLPQAGPGLRGQPFGAQLRGGRRGAADRDGEGLCGARLRRAFQRRQCARGHRQCPALLPGTGRARGRRVCHREPGG